MKVDVLRCCAPVMVMCLGTHAPTSVGKDWHVDKVMTDLSRAVMCV